MKKTDGRDREGIYESLAGRGWPKTYRGKIFLVAFVGTHIPLIALLGYAISHSAIPIGFRTSVVVVALLATLAGAALTLWGLGCLLVPIQRTGDCLQNFLRHGEVPTLPERFDDEAGLLMRNTGRVIGELDASIRRLDLSDPETALPNRKALLIELDRLRSEGRHTAVIVIEILGFDEVRGGLGRRVAADTLRDLTVPILSQLPKDAMVARIGDETFAVALQVSTAQQAVVTAQTIQQALTKSAIEFASDSLHIRAAIGVAFAGSDIGDAVLVSQAEAAKQLAKHGDGDEISIYGDATDETLVRRIAVESGLVSALANGNLRLAYQPIVDTRTGTPTMIEVLLRWTSDSLGEVSPVEFIPAAERTHLIVPIGNWVLRKAVKLASTWDTPPFNAIRLSINVSPRQLMEVGFLEVIDEVLAKYQFDPSRLQLEITESALLEEGSPALRTLAQLRERGVRIALDDFGTGYSSLFHLKVLPIDVLKIDRQFVQGLPEDDFDRALLASMVALADRLGIDLVAEGVEKVSQATCLREHGCRYLQGYLFGRPLPAEAYLGQEGTFGYAVIEVTDRDRMATS